MTYCLDIETFKEEFANLDLDGSDHLDRNELPTNEAIFNHLDIDESSLMEVNGIMLTNTLFFLIRNSAIRNLRLKFILVCSKN